MTSLPVDGGPGLGGALRQAYQAARRHLPDGAPAQVLHIGAEHSGVVSGTGADPAEGVVWPLGAHQIVRACFRRTVPTPLELENAIAVIEDALMRPRPLALGGATVWCADPQVRDIARRAGLPLEAGGAVVLTLDTLEPVFERLAAVAQGRPVGQGGLPETPAWAATLLILRECLHHLRFESVTVLG